MKFVITLKNLGPSKISSLFKLSIMRIERLIQIRDRNQETKISRNDGASRAGWVLSLLAGLLAFWHPTQDVHAHIVPPENLHPVAEIYRRAVFTLNLNPVPWDQIRSDVDAFGSYWKSVDSTQSEQFRRKAETILARASVDPEKQNDVEFLPRKDAALHVFRLLTRSVASLIQNQLIAAERNLGQHANALKHVNEAREIYAAFEDVVLATDPEAGARIGINWLKMIGAIGSPGLLGVGEIKADPERFARESRDILAYTRANFHEGVVPAGRKLAPWPVNSPSFNPNAKLPAKLPPGHNVNKQIPRPRQILNMTARGVDESETPLIAVGDMAFDSSFIYGEPMRSLGMSCNTCHNKSITNPNFVIPGLSVRPGGMDVSNGFFAPHANNGVFDPLDIPDLRGIRFTAPYGRNGRFASLREFTRNVIVNEFNGDEPDPTLLDGMIAYMNEFDFLPNPMLNRDGTLNERASNAALRGEKLFSRAFPRMNGMSCASCHIPSAQFLDHKRHNIGSVRGVSVDSIDQAMDTPTLLSAKFTPPYFHDGSLPTLRSVNEWFNTNYQLNLSASELDDLTAYVEVVGDGSDAYENSSLYLDAEMEEFSFFLSAYEFLDEKKKPELINVTFQTVALEIRNHKWELQDSSVMPVMDRLAELMDEAHQASLKGDQALVANKVREYRNLYESNVEILK